MSSLIPPRWRVFALGVRYLFSIVLAAVFLAGAFSAFLQDDAGLTLIFGFLSGVWVMLTAVHFGELAVTASRVGEAS